MANETLPVPNTPDEWLRRCATRFENRYGIAAAEAQSLAQSQFENCGFDFTESPEEAADDEVSHWVD